MPPRQTFLLAALFTLASSAAAPSAAEAGRREKPERSLLAPPLARGMTRVQGTVRPFFNIAGPGAGLLADMSVEHYFQSPLELGFEISPLALVGEPAGLGAIGHARVRAAFASDAVEIGVGVGARLQHFGPSGLSVSPAFRVGALDGLSLRVELGHSLVRNYYTGAAEFAWSHVMGSAQVPVSRKAAITLDGGYGLDLWVYTNIGLRQRVSGDGGPKSLFIGASTGIVWIVDRFPCQYGDITPCRGAAWGTGPTIAVRFDKRF